MPDTQITCAECKETFTHTEEEQEWMKKTFDDYAPPKYCPDCRRKRRANGSNKKWPAEVVEYLHGGENDHHNINDTYELEMNTQQLDTLKFFLNEVELKLRLHKDGEVEVLAVNDMPVMRKK